MAKDSEEARARAEARFRKQHEQDKVAEAARAEQVVQAQAVEAKTARLKALRLAKEADDQAEARRAPPQKRKT